MKKLRLSVILAMVCMAICTVSAPAAGNLTAELAYYAAECKITVSGVSGTMPVKPVDLIVLKGEKLLEDMQAADKPVDFRTVYTEAGGEYSVTAPLSGALDGGVYTVYISSDEGKIRKTFVFINETQSGPALRQINGATDEGGVKTVISTNAEEFGLTAKQVSSGADMIAKIVYAGKPFGGYKAAAEVHVKAMLAIAVNEIKAAGSTSELDAAIKDNKSVLGIDYAEYYALETGVKEKLLAILKTADYTKDGFVNIFESSKTVAKIQGASSWSKLKEAVTAGADNLGINIADGSNYSKVKNKDNVFQKMYKKDLSSVEKIKESFSASVIEALKDQEKGSTGGSSGSGGSGGGSGIGSVEIDSSLVNNAAQTDTKTEGKAVNFTDISGHWAENEIRRMSEKGVVNGFADKTFRPDSNVTRAEFVKIIVSAFELKANGAAEYADVSSGDWFADYVQTASSLNIVSGYNGYFSPDNAISRQDAAVIVYRLLGVIGVSADGSAVFADSGSIADYAQEAVEALAANSIMVGSNSEFAPEAPATRAQVVKIVTNVMRYIGRE